MNGKKRVLAGLAAAMIAALPAAAEEITFDSAAEWETWDIPHGLVRVNDAGHLELVRYRKNIEAVEEARSFTHATRAHGVVSGGIWHAGSSPFTASRLIDGDPGTYWKPSASDELSQWTVEVDLGRAVLAKEIRLVFPDEEGARPFRQFAVFVATGATIQATDDVYKYDLVYRTTRPNQETDLRLFIDGTRDTTKLVDPDLDVDLETESRHRGVQFILFQADEVTPDASLAELEVLAVGDNVSIGVLERGGSFRNGRLTGQPQNMFDGNMDTNAGIVTVTYGGRELRGWEESGVWWEVDLGALFWLDGIYIYNKQRGEALSSFSSDRLNSGSGFQILSSDGTRTISGSIDYDLLVLEPEGQTQQELRVLQFRYLFRPRKIRHLFLHALYDRDWYTHPMEFMLFSEGHPAQVVARSDFIDLGRLQGDLRPKAIRTIAWDAGLPPDTRMQVRSRSGNELGEEYTFYNKIGEEETEEKWKSLPKSIRGPVDTSVVVGHDWSPWSNEYQASGEVFQSPSPRRYTQLEVVLSTEDRLVAPVLRSLSVEFDDALVWEASGRVVPRSVTANVDTGFVYTLTLRPGEGDSGFDVMRLIAPGPVVSEELFVEIGDHRVTPQAIEAHGDSVTITLADVVVGDSVEVGFRTRVLNNASVVDLYLGNQARPGLWQSVEAAESKSNVVFLSDLPESSSLIHGLSLNTRVVTPNGDGVNDRMELGFAVLKVGSENASVRIFDMSGRQVALLRQGKGSGVVTFAWTGVDDEGQPVPPGLYLAMIEVDSMSGVDREVRSFSVAY